MFLNNQEDWTIAWCWFTKEQKFTLTDHDFLKRQKVQSLFLLLCRAVFRYIGTMLELNGSCHFGDLWRIETLNAPSKCSSSAGNKFILLSVDTHILALHTVMCSLTFNDVHWWRPSTKSFGCWKCTDWSTL